MLIKKVWCFAIAFLICSIFDAYAFDDQITHQDITRQAIENSDLNTYIIGNLDSQGGIETKLIGKSILNLLREGSKLEDTPVCRASNHFHNPLLSWEQSFMTDDILTPKGTFVREKCNITGWPYGGRQSNISWATGYQSPAPEGVKISMSKQEMNWDDAREYYRLALTESSITLREDNFAKTFQAIGQVIHLLEDMAVPAHTRYDFSKTFIKEEA